MREIFREVFNKPKGLFSFEMIDYQDHKFGIQLEEILTDLQVKIRDHVYRFNKDIRDSIEVRNLKKVIFKRLGIKVKIVTNSALAAVLPFYPTVNHVFLNEFWRGRAHDELPDQAKLVKESEKTIGYVNLARAELGGVFSQYENTLYMNFERLFMVHELTVPEVTAAILHELGHVFYACEYSDRMNSTNQILAQAVKDLSSKDKEKKLNYIFKNLQSVNHEVTEADVNNIVNGNKIVAGYAFFKVVMGSISSQLKNDKYDETSFEQLADSFAARFQYGRPLITALDKLGVEYGNPDKVRAMRVFLMLLNGSAFIGLIAGIVATFAYGLFPWTIILSFVFYICLRWEGEHYQDYTYDELRVRYSRVRNEYVGMIKKLDLADSDIKDQVKNILDNILAIDTIIKDTEQYKNIFQILGNLFFKVNRDPSNSIEEQRLLESLAFNDLFIKSAQLHQ